MDWFSRLTIAELQRDIQYMQMAIMDGQDPHKRLPRWLKVFEALLELKKETV